MSTVKRLLSGTIASWARLIVTILTQIILVPVFLSYWDVKTYGIWLSIQAIVLLTSTFDRGYVDYLGFEFLTFGRSNASKVSLYLRSGIATLILTGLTELIVLLFFLSSNYAVSLLYDENSTNSLVMEGAAGSLVCQWFGWVFLSNTTGLYYRALSVWGYFSKMAWWDAGVALCTSILTMVIVVNGGTILSVGVGNLLLLIVATLMKVYDIRCTLKKEKIHKETYSLSLGYKNYYLSLLLSLRYLLENFRQQGLRLFLAPVIGINGLAAFSTMRTQAYVVQQGLISLTNPVLPELMRFISKKEQNKIEVTLGTVWLILIGIISPGVLILQAVAPTLFMMWTKGKIIFDVFLFASFSASILFYAFCLPAMTIVIGTNLLKAQIIVSVTSTLMLVGCLLFLVPQYNLVGVGTSLVLSELTSAIGFTYYARNWFRTNSLIWPAKSADTALFSVLLTLTAMVALSWFSSSTRLIVCMYFIFYIIILSRCRANIPSFAKEIANKFFLNFS